MPGLVPLSPRRFRLAAALLSISCLTSSALLAAPLPAGSPEDESLWEKLDGNQSGWLSGIELNNGEWLKYDTNKDREVTKDEFLAGRAAERKANPAAATPGAAPNPAAEEALWKQLDKTETGYLSGTELAGGLSRYDTNKDGRLSKAEFLAGRAADVAAGKAPAPANAEPATPVAPAPRPMIPGMVIPTPGDPAPVAPPAAGAPPVAAPPTAMPPAAAPPLPPLSTTDAAGKPKALDDVKISQFDGAEYCDLAIGADGVYHAVYNERPSTNAAPFLYYRRSADGVTWSAAVNLSDDESGLGASHSRVVVDGRGRVYAIWKSIKPERVFSMDGPGGSEPGNLMYRCLEGGNWSAAVNFGTEKAPQFSWFAAIDPNGTAHVVWSEMAEDAFARRKTAYKKEANRLKQTSLNGPTLGAVKTLVDPPALPTDAQIAAGNKLGGKNILSYEDQYPKPLGIWNLRGYVDASGVARFLAEQPKRTPGFGEGAYLEGPVVYWDGAAFKEVFTINMSERDGNSFTNPPTLLADAAGKPHMIRAPSSKKVERACIRDYPLTAEGKQGAPVDIMAVKQPGGTINYWQVWQLPGGRMAVAGSLYDRPAGKPDGERASELYVSFSDGNGKWSEPLCVTDNAGRSTFASRQTNLTDYSNLTMYEPKYAAIAAGPDGRLAVLMVNDGKYSFSFPGGVIAGGGRAIVIQSGGQVSKPAVYFHKL